MLKVTYLGTTTLLFDDGKDQILFDAHITRPSLSSYIRGAKESTNRALCDEIIRLHHIDRSPVNAAQRFSEVSPLKTSHWAEAFRQKTSRCSSMAIALISETIRSVS